MNKIDLINGIEVDFKLTLDDFIHVLKALTTDVIEIKKEIKALKDNR